MPTPNGYVNQKKREDRSNEFVTISPSTGKDKFYLDVAMKGTVYVADTDQAEAGSTDTVINATAHLAQPGDLIRFTTGALTGEERYVYEVTANTITLYDNLSAAPAASDEFDILKGVTLTLGADGSFSGPVKYILDGTITDVEEDTGTPANNRPLPVKITSATGDINITANDLNVQLSHNAATPDSVQIGDGTEVVAINPSNEMQVADDTARTSLGNIDTSTATIAGDTTSLDTKIDVNLSTRASELTLAAAEVHLGNIDTATASINASFDVALSTRASEVTLAAAEVHLGNIDAATTSIDTAFDVNLSTRATEVTLASADAHLAAIEVDTGNIATGVASIDTNINVDLSTRASEVTVAAILADTAAIDTSTATIATNTTTMAGWDTNAGAVTANTQRVHLTNENLAALEEVIVNVNLSSVFTSTYTDASVSNIPGNASLPLQLVASSATETTKLQFADTTGAFLEIMTGAAASEVRACLVGPGSDSTVEISIPAASRISVRRVDDAAALSVGSLAINYIG